MKALKVQAAALTLAMLAPMGSAYASVRHHSKLKGAMVGAAAGAVVGGKKGAVVGAGVGAAVQHHKNKKASRY